MHVTGFWGALGAVITGLIAADILYHWRGSSKLLGTSTKFGTAESKLLAGRG